MKVSNFNSSLLRKLNYPVCLLLLLSFIGCGSVSDFRTNAGKDTNTRNTAGEFGAPLPLPLSKKLLTNSKLTAQLIIDGNEKNPINLTVDTTNKVVNGKVDKLEGGSHNFEIIYYVDSIKVAAINTRAVVEAGKDNPMTFEPNLIHYSDDDRDGFTNLAELDLGTYFNGERPKAESLRSSGSYVLADTVVTPADGKSAVVGRASSKSYSLY